MTAALEKDLKRLSERHEATPEGRAFAPLADCYRKLGRLDEAYELCRDGLDRHPAYSTAVVILAKIQRDRGEVEQAMEAFQRVLDLDPLNLLARAELARLFEKVSRGDEALFQWRQLLQSDPSSQEAEEAIERILVPVTEEIDEEAAAELEKPAPTAYEAPEADALEVPEVLQATLGEPDDLPEPQLELSGPATPTLARIYYEQGFKAKALEVYERVLAQRGEDVALAERIDEIRDELAHVERRRAERPEDAGGLLEASKTDPAVPTRQRPVRPPLAAEEGVSGNSADVEILAASIEASDPEREDYGNFRSWLDRVRDP